MQIPFSFDDFVKEIGSLEISKTLKKLKQDCKNRISENYFFAGIPRVLFICKGHQNNTGSPLLVITTSQDRWKYFEHMRTWCSEAREKRFTKEEERTISEQTFQLKLLGEEEFRERKLQFNHLGEEAAPIKIKTGGLCSRCCLCRARFDYLVPSQVKDIERSMEWKLKDLRWCDCAESLAHSFCTRINKNT
jgi:hypothetical protein